MSSLAPTIRAPGRQLLTRRPSRDSASILRDFLDSQAERTRQAYASDLRDFARWLGMEPAEAATWFVLQDSPGVNSVYLEYRAFLREQGKSPATIRRRRAALKSLLQMARMVGVSTAHLEVKGERCENYRDTRGPGRAKIDAMFADLEAKVACGNRQAVRDRALACLLFNRGLRKGEVTGLNLEHYDPEQSRVFVKSKATGNRGWKTIPAKAKAALDAWVQVRGDWPGALFVSCRSRASQPGRLDERQPNRIFKPYGIRPHGFRHTAITEALKATGGDVSRVREFSGHKSVAVVMIYKDHLDDEGGQVAEILENFADMPTAATAPDVTDDELATLTPTQAGRVKLALGGMGAAEIARRQGVSRAPVRASLEEAEAKIPNLRRRLELAGTHRTKKGKPPTDESANT